MKILYINAGLEDGGGKNHILGLMSQFKAGEVELLVFHEGMVAFEARERGFPVEVIEQTSRYDLSVLKKIILFINQKEFDIVHTHGARANFLIELIKNKLNAQWIVTVHSDPKLDFAGRGPAGRIFGNLNIRSLKKADAVIAVTENFLEMLADMGVPRDKLYAVYNGIVYDAAEPDKPKNTVFTLTCIARLHPIKGHKLLLESLKASSFKNYQLNIIGDGELRKSLEQEVKKLGLEEKIAFFGFLARPEIETVLRTTDVGVLASYSESFPLVLLESANQRVPFISTDVGDVSKLCPDETYGWIVPVGDQPALTDALESAHRAWQNGELEEKGQKLFSLASTEFSLSALYKKTVEIYQKLL